MKYSLHTKEYGPPKLIKFKTYRSIDVFRQESDFYTGDPKALTGNHCLKGRSSISVPISNDKDLILHDKRDISNDLRICFGTRDYFNNWFTNGKNIQVDDEVLTVHSRIRKEVFEGRPTGRRSVRKLRKRWGDSVHTDSASLLGFENCKAR